MLVLIFLYVLMNVNIIFIIQVLIAAQSIFFTFYLLSGKQRKYTRNKILSALTLIVALIMIFNWIPVYEYSIPNLNLVFGLTIGPLIYLCGKSLIYKSFKLTSQNLLHFLPLGFFLILLITVDIQVQFYAWAIFISIFAYNVLSFYMLYHYSKISKMIDGNYDRLRLNWFKAVLWISLLIIIANVVSFILQPDSNSSPSSPDAIILFLLILIMINFIVFQALKHPEIFVDIDDVEIKNLVSESKKNQPVEKYESIFSEIETIMQKEQLYLNPDFLITDLAKVLKQPYKRISQAINTNTDLNFSEYVNKYRINEVKSYFENPVHQSKNVLEVMYECGFNTKSNFNRAFKKFTGFTPSQFKKNSQK